MAFMEFLKFPTRSTFPAIGDKNRLYIDLRSKKIYYWEHGAYQIASPDIVEQGSNPSSEVFGYAGIVAITWSALKTLRDDGKLVPGAHYRITDYITTTTQANTQSAEHQFDIIVTADSTNKLNEQARAIQHAGDTYFADSQLEAWQVWYSLDNDTDRFTWADEVNGKGVIYHLIDEGQNDLFYDFKNIQFLNDGVYYYTFGGLDDRTLRPISGNTYNNKIGAYSLTGKYGLAKNIFLEGGRNNTFGRNSENNISRTFFAENIFGYSTSNNNFGSYSFFGNIAGNYFSNNIFFQTVSQNIFGNNFQYAHAESCKYLEGNTFGNNCDNIYFNGWHFRNNHIGNNNKYLYFKENCSNNIFGNNNTYIMFGVRCWHNTIGNGCSYLSLEDNTSSNKYNIHIDNYVRGVSAVNKLELYDDAVLNKSYQVNFKKDISGRILMTWQDDKLIEGGKYKDNNVDPTWKNLLHDIDGGVW